ncbi:hypothetical protein [Vibrio stylophorae]|uniref:hypothetical protein n=1 Tax=Vibrio stylophorae TaxID=659351 RepID=UPI001F3FDAAC|nr:hypothetical protein [Vibrio stylophorae]
MADIEFLLSSTNLNKERGGRLGAPAQPKRNKKTRKEANLKKTRNRAIAINIRDQYKSQPKWEAKWDCC